MSLKLSKTVLVTILLLITATFAYGKSSNCEQLVGSGQWSADKQYFSYFLPSNSNDLYPDRSWLPCPYRQACPPKQQTMKEYCDSTYFNRGQKKQYKKQYTNYICKNNEVVEDKGVYSYTDFNYQENSCDSWETALYGDLRDTIKYYTNLSVRRAGQDSNYTVDDVEYNNDYQQFKVVLKSQGSASQQAMETFAATHQRFLCIAGQGLNGIKACQNDLSGKCWQPYYDATKPLTSHNYPWTFFLPLGMAMTNQKIVNFLNYPPFDALDSADYMKNFTMCRWNSVLQTAGIENTFLYETIVDSHPIAAPGSGQQGVMPDATTYFNNPGKNRYYDTPMVSLLADTGSSTSLPILVLGTDAREAWAKVIGVNDLNINPDTGKPFKSMPYVGTYKNKTPTGTIDMPWIASNHPDVTTYNCCAGDPDSHCSSKKYGHSWSLLQDETIDLIAICISQTLADNPSKTPMQARNSCQKTWNWETADADHRYKICVQAKMDYNYTAQGQCKTLADAQAFCHHYKNPCPTDINPNPNLLADPNKAKNATTKAEYYTCEVPKH